MKKVSKTLCAYVAFAVVYLVLSWVTTSNNNPAVSTYHLSSTALHLISLSVALPLIGIWLVALYGYAKFGEYAELVKNNKDGRKVAKLARGLGFLAFSLPLSSIITGALNYAGERWVRSLPSTTIIAHYASLLLPLIAFWLINRATWELMTSIKKQPPVWIYQLFIFVVVVIGVIYCYLVFKNGALPGISNRRVYYLPNWLVVSTVIIPYVFMWALGGLSALGIYVYEKRLSGVLYRHNWNFISAGVAVIVVAEIAAQYLGTLSAHLSHAHLSVLLLIVYLLLAVIAGGFVLVAVGASKLRRIEEV